MAWGQYVLDKGYNPAAAVTKFRAVKFSANHTVTPVTGITDVIAGWVQYGVATAEVAKGKDVSVRMLGVTEAEASGAIAVGNYCQLENDGRVKVLTGSSGALIVGKCVGVPSTNAGDRIAMLIIHTNAVA
jgi:hypothetical protein